MPDETAPASCPETTSPSPQSAPSAEELCRLYGNDDEHSFYVAELATQVFRATRAIHGLPDSLLPLLRAAAQLHNVGLYFGQARHHVHSKNIILQHGVAGFDGREVQMIACVALFHRKKVRPEEEPLLQSLPEPLQRQTRRLAAIVRVADGLDYSQDQSTTIEFADATRHRVRFFISGDEVALNADRANRKADLWDAEMPRPVRFAPEVRNRYHLRRGDTTQAAAYKVFTQLYETIRQRETDVRDRFDIEDLHKFRVATRRFRASLWAFRRTFGRELLEPLNIDVRETARATGEARNLDVLLESVSDHAEAERMPALFRQLRQDRKRASDAVRRALDADAYQRFVAHFPKFLEHIDPYDHPLDRKWARRKARSAGPALVARQLAKVVAFRDTIRESGNEGAHRLRIACKRLRYVTEFFSDVLAGPEDLLIRPLKALQDSLGDNRDADYQINYVTRLLEAHRAGPADDDATPALEPILPDEEQTLEMLVNELVMRQERALSRFEEQWAEFVSDEFQARVIEEYGLQSLS